MASGLEPVDSLSMELGTRLEATTLGDLLGGLHRAEVTGVLRLEEPGRGVHEIKLRAGEVSQVRTSHPTSRLGDILRNTGRLGSRARAQLERCSYGLKGRLLGEALVADGIVSERLVRQALHRQAWLRLESVFTVSRARLSFRIARGRTSHVSPRLSVSEVLKGRARARDASTTSRARRRRTRPPASQAHLQACEVLGVSSNATEAQVRSAFRTLGALAHPDVSGTNQAQFKRLSRAYHQLLRAD